MKSPRRKDWFASSLNSSCRAGDMNFYNSRKAVRDFEFSVPSSQFSEKARAGPLKTKQLKTENRKPGTLLIQSLQMAKAIGRGEHRDRDRAVVGHVDYDSGGHGVRLCSNYGQNQTY